MNGAIVTLGRALPTPTGAQLALRHISLAQTPNQTSTSGKPSSQSSLASEPAAGVPSRQKVKRPSAGKPFLRRRVMTIGQCDLASRHFCWCQEHSFRSLSCEAVSHCMAPMPLPSVRGSLSAVRPLVSPDDRRFEWGLSIVGDHIAPLKICSPLASILKFMRCENSN